LGFWRFAWGLYCMKLAKLLLILLPPISFFYSCELFSATATGSFLVSATVLNTCTVATTPLVFGNYTSAQVDQTNTVTVTCTVGTGYTLGLDAGAASGATVTTRAMTGGGSGTDTLPYFLYSDAGRTTNWGNSSGTWVSNTATLTPTIHTVYGRILASITSASVGAYTDTINITVTY
jgi:spore coat protein U-like protein